MSISNTLRDASLRYECPSCHQPIIRNGSWFKAVSAFRCDGCKTKLRLGCSAKLALSNNTARGRGRDPCG
jgi:predicted RNA-binding Zn-ribbon protein involved in translation (DUF1610 family)